ncbi:MAG: tRNA pseudouridine(55) synthase TruB, partial [Bacteroidales bacterium]|nr:tRNA pseudouridine(55) synthase TruB [Bacteroidales bacterium]
MEAGRALLIDKPYTWTSFDVVGKVRSWAKRRCGKKIKVGHAGTLDPLATGLLIVCTGRFTKRIEEFQAQEKEYTGTFVLGGTTPSYDLETEVVPCGPYGHLTAEDLQATAGRLSGLQQQVPPVFSAVKVGGKKAYEYARKDKEIVLQPKPVHIHTFELTRIALPEVDFRIVCSKGTYIRSIARDFGDLLGCGAYLSALRRTRIGGFNVQDAISPRDLP